MNDDVLGQPAREALGETARRCTGTNRSGEQCRRAPIVGGFVCTQHGGGTPAVQRSARERLLALVEPALDVLLRATRQAPPCPVCGRSDADRDPVAVRAAGMILDRAGYHPTLNVHASNPAPSFAGLTLAQLADRAEILARAARAQANAEAQRMLPPASVDAVVVDADAHPRKGETVPGGD